MVGEAPAHNEARGRDLYAPLIGGPPLRARIVPKRAMSEAEMRAVSAGARRAIGRDGGSKHSSSPRIFLADAGGRTSHGIPPTSFRRSVGQFKPARPWRMA